MKHRGYKSSDNWDMEESYYKDVRQLSPVRNIIINGSVDLVFRHSDEPYLVVAGETKEAAECVKTILRNGTLSIYDERGVNINIVSISNYSNTVISSNGKTRIFVNGQEINCQTPANHGHVVVYVGLQKLSELEVQGSGKAVMLDILQDELSVDVQGSGDIEISGEATLLDANISGSGDIDARRLSVNRGILNISGSGRIDAFVSESVTARISGSGNITVFGNPDIVREKVSGSGRVRFRS